MNPYFTAGLVAEHRAELMKEAALHRQELAARASRPRRPNWTSRVGASHLFTRVIQLRKRRIAPAIA